jgi:hypothetical protein
MCAVVIDISADTDFLFLAARQKISVSECAMKGGTSASVRPQTAFELNIIPLHQASTHIDGRTRFETDSR